MADLRSCRSAFVLLLVAGSAVWAGSPSGFQCAAGSLDVPTIRAEGLAEEVGHVTLTCTGGVPTPPGVTIPQTDITIALGGSVTSRTLGAATNVLLFIDDPSPAVQIFCPLPQTGCPVTGTGGVVSFGASGLTNVYQGVLSGSNAVTFHGVPLEPPAPGGPSRIYRVDNLRTDATAYPPSFIFAHVPAFVQFSNPAVPIANSQFNVAATVPSLNFQGNYSVPHFQQCQSYPRTQVASLFFQENFSDAFKIRVAGAQNQPGIFYDTESSALTATPYGTTGLADFGTRFVATLRDLPTGVMVYADNASGVVGQNRAVFVGNSPTSPDPGTGLPPDPGDGVTLVSSGDKSTVTVVWEVISTNSVEPEGFSFGIYVSYTGGSAGVTTAIPSVTSGLGPQFTGTPNTIPAFVPSSIPASSLFTIYPCGVSTNTISGHLTLNGSGVTGTVTLTGSQTGSLFTDSGNYTFTVLSGGNYTVTPVAAGLAFSPLSKTVSNLATDQIVNFTAQCRYSLTYPPLYLDSASQAGPTIAVNTYQFCSWSANGSDFLTITSPPPGLGSGTVTFSVSANDTGLDRIANFPVADQSLSVTQRGTATIFKDVAPSAYYFDFVTVLDQHGITSGCLVNPPEYCPDSPITRGQMAVFLVTSIIGSASFNYNTIPYFTDVSSSDPFFKFIQKLRELGITAGCSATEFCPNNLVTRAQMADFIILSRFETTPFTYPPAPYFTDEPATDGFFPFVQKMRQLGITSGCAPTLYCPGDTLTRGQMAVFVVTGLLNQLLPGETPYIASASPATLSPGQTATVALTGVNTHFTTESTHVTAAPGIAVSHVNVTGPTTLTVQLAVPASMRPNPTSLVVTTGSEEADLPNEPVIQ